MSIFSKVQGTKPKSSNFNLSEETKLSMNFGDLVPILCKETLPGDKFKISTELLIKLAPLKAPVMHRLNAYVHYFFVPNYQINKTFEKFINPKVNSDNSVVLPYVTPQDITDLGLMGKSSLSDYLGLPILNYDWTSSESKISILPFLCYQHIYNSYYRDQNMELLPSEGVSIDSTNLFSIEDFLDLSGRFDSGDAGSMQFENLFKLRKRAWKKDYFTSALPSPQAGNDVLIPINSPISFTSPLSMGQQGNVVAKRPQGFTETILQTESGATISATAVNQSASINDLRRAMALQRFKELAERGGTRYSEMVRNFYGAFLPDFWVDRPIYLGGQRTPVNIGEVVQTSQTTSSDPSSSSWSAQGSRAGIGSAYGKTSGVSIKCPCHGFIFGILSIRPEATYSQGVERMWTRESIFDYAFPQFANLGEQEIYQREIYATGNDSQDKKVFGYTPRYAEYKEGHCHVCGEFRDTLSYWHFGRKFNNAPQLNANFIQMNQMNYEPFNVTDTETEHVYVNLYNNIYARRPLPYFGTPSIL